MHICIAMEFWKYLVMKAKNPTDGKTYYFVDKCLPFGASISCAIFQAFSDALAHIVRYKTKRNNINYLDDFFFVDALKKACDQQIQTFLEVCGKINFPVSMDKTVWGTTTLVFLGLLIDTEKQLVSIPVDKIMRAINLIEKMLNSSRSRTTLKELQRLCGFLNFIGKAIVPGRAFTRRLYTFGNGILKPHHHLPIKEEMKMDLNMWLTFLRHPNAFSRPFFEFNSEEQALQLNWYTDAAGSAELGCGGFFNSEWFIIQWEEEFMYKNRPSINYLELYAVTIGILLWTQNFRNRKIILFCDNMSVVQMVNRNSSTCKNCMVLMRIIVLHSMINNVKVILKHVPGIQNSFADLISRLEYKKFRQLARKRKVKFDSQPREIPKILWPMGKIWIN